MKERRKMIEVTHNVVIPDIVNQKCREAYDEIYRECEQENENKSYFQKTEKNDGDVNEVVYRNCEHETKNHRSVFRKVIAVAACAAVLSAGIVIPAASRYAPSIKSAFGGTEREESTESAEENESGTEKPEAADTDIDIELKKTYCDGSNVYAALALTPGKNVPEDITAIYGDISVTIGTEVYSDSACFQKSLDGRYYAELYYYDMEITDVTEFKVKIPSFHGENGLMQHGEINSDGLVNYKPESVALKGNYEYKGNIVPDLSHNKIYGVCQTQDGITLNAVEITPFMTKVYIDGLDEEHSIRLRDQNKMDIDYKPVGFGVYFNTPYEDTEELYFEVFSLIQDGFPVEYEFYVPIEKSQVYDYRLNVKYDADYRDESKIVYDPPIEEIDAEYISEINDEFNKIRDTVKSLPAGSKFNTKRGNEKPYSMTITDSYVGDINDYDLNIDPGVNGLVVYENAMGSLDGAVVMFVTCEIENLRDKPVTLCLGGLNLISKDYSSDDIPNFCKTLSEYNYVSYKENYGKNSNIYEFEPREIKTITYGYVIPDYCAETGYLACFYDPDAYGSTDEFKDILDGKAFLCEIK